MVNVFSEPVGLGSGGSGCTEANLAGVFLAKALSDAEG